MTKHRSGVRGLFRWSLVCDGAADLQGSGLPLVTFPLPPKAGLGSGTPDPPSERDRFPKGKPKVLPRTVPPALLHRSLPPGLGISSLRSSVSFCYFIQQAYADPRRVTKGKWSIFSQGPSQALYQVSFGGSEFHDRCVFIQEK